MNLALADSRVALAYLNDRLPDALVTAGFAPGEEETGCTAERHGRRNLAEPGRARAPDHCPPRSTFVHHLADGRSKRLDIHYV
jgi:hypothetical protein